MLLLPWKVDVPFERTPVTNWLLIASIVVVFMLEMAWAANNPFIITEVDPENSNAQVQSTPFDPYVLSGFTNIRGLFGHMWLHANFLHLFGNMLFLWIFGNAICQKTGNGVYLLLYLLVGMAAAFVYLLFSDEKMIGASGAINGVVGMYLVFYPLNDITCLYWIPFPMMYAYGAGFRTFSISSFWMILLWLSFDIFGAVAGGGPVAYCAHLGGFTAGVGIAFLLLITRRVKMERYERSLLQIIKREPQITWVPKEEPMPWEQGGDYVKEELDLEKVIKPVKLKDLMRSDGTIRQAEKPTFTETGYVDFSCFCGQRIRTPSANAGRQGLCPKCGNFVRVPLQSEGPAG